MAGMTVRSVLSKTKDVVLEILLLGVVGCAACGVLAVAFILLPKTAFTPEGPFHLPYPPPAAAVGMLAGGFALRTFSRWPAWLLTLLGLPVLYGAVGWIAWQDYWYWDSPSAIERWLPCGAVVLGVLLSGWSKMRARASAALGGSRRPFFSYVIDGVFLMLGMLGIWLLVVLPFPRHIISSYQSVAVVVVLAAANAVLIVTRRL